MQIHSCSLQPGHSLSTALPWSCHRCLRAAPRASLGSSVPFVLTWERQRPVTLRIARLHCVPAVTPLSPVSSSSGRRQQSKQLLACYKVRGEAASHEAQTCSSRRPFSIRPRGHKDTLFTGRVKLGPCRASVKRRGLLGSASHDCQRWHSSEQGRGRPGSLTLRGAVA